MIGESKRFQIAVRRMTLSVIFVITCVLSARGSFEGLDKADRQMRPSVVLIKTGSIMASGFVIDASGLIATTFSTIEGARSANVRFPGDHNPKTCKNTYAVEGFVAAMPDVNFALIKIKPTQKTLQPLKLAKELPAGREEVYVFGVTSGGNYYGVSTWIAAVGTGNKIRSLLEKGGYGDLIATVRGRDATWIDFPTSRERSCSGGPLANIRGEVVGMAIWKGEETEGIALSSIDIRKFIAKAPKKVKPLSELPAKQKTNSSERAEQHPTSVSPQQEDISKQRVNDLTEVIGKVQSSVVELRIKTEDNVFPGGGFVIDSTGLIATSYHVITQAQEITAIPIGNNNDNDTLRVEGWAAIDPGRDLALLKVKVGQKKLQPLLLAGEMPVKGQSVLEIGNSAYNGTVVAVRSGKDVKNILRGGGRDMYTDILGFGLDVTWIQSTTPLMPGGSGFPLVNLRGKVLGVATMSYCIKENQYQYYFVSATDLRQLISKAGTKVMPLKKLPAGISHPSEPPEVSRSKDN